MTEPAFDADHAHGRPGCTAQHRTFRTMAACIWPRAAWVLGNGPFASVSRCRGRITVQLHNDEQQARSALATIDSTACGGLCSRQHALVRIALPGGAR